MLLAIYWATTLAHDPAMLHVPPAVVHLRRASILLIALSLLWTLTFAYDKTWEPWPPYLAVVGSFDIYLVLSIASAIIRRRVCAVCPVLTKDQLKSF